MFLLQKKIVFWEFVFGLKILYLFGDFPSDFSLFKTLCFLTLELILLSYLLGSLFSEKILVCGCGNHQVIIPPTLCYPSCVEVDFGVVVGSL